MIISGGATLWFKFLYITVRNEIERVTCIQETEFSS